MNQDVLTPAATGMADSSFYGMLTEQERVRLLHEKTATRMYLSGYILMMENERSSYVIVLLAGQGFVKVLGGV